MSTHHNIQKPHLEEVGPYNFTRKYCKFDVHLEGDYLYSRYYVEPWVQAPDPDHPDVNAYSDVVINFNPGTQQY
jgi:hypothetical protein